MIKNLSISIFIIIGFLSNSSAQINEDSKKISRKNIKEIHLRNGEYQLKFDSNGALQKMTQSRYSYEEVYTFTPEGNLILFEQLEIRSEDKTLIKKRIISEYDEYGKLTAEFDCSFENANITDSCPSKLDSAIYLNQMINGRNVISEIQSRVTCFQFPDSTVFTRHDYDEETETIIQLNDSTTRINFHRIHYNDTTKKSSLSYTVNSKNEIVKIIRYVGHSDEIHKEFFDCKMVAPYVYECSYIHKTGDILKQIITLRTILYSKEKLYENLPFSWGGMGLSCCVAPFKTLKAVKKELGKDSIQIIRF